MPESKTVTREEFEELEDRVLIIEIRRETTERIITWLGPIIVGLAAVAIGAMTT